VQRPARDPVKGRLAEVLAEVLVKLRPVEGLAERLLERVAPGLLVDVARNAIQGPNGLAGGLLKGAARTHFSWLSGRRVEGVAALAGARVSYATPRR